MDWSCFTTEVSTLHDIDLLQGYDWNQDEMSDLYRKKTLQDLFQLQDQSVKDCTINLL